MIRGHLRVWLAILAALEGWVRIFEQLRCDRLPARTYDWNPSACSEGYTAEI